MGDVVDRQTPQTSGVHRGFDTGSEESEAVASIDSAPLLPAEHGGGFDQGDPTKRGIETSGEEGVTAGAQGIEGVIVFGRGGDETFDAVLLLVLVQRPKKSDLVGEVVIDGALGDACGSSNVVERGGGPPVFNVELAGRVEDASARPRRAFGLTRHVVVGDERAAYPTLEDASEPASSPAAWRTDELSATSLPVVVVPLPDRYLPSVCNRRLACCQARPSTTRFPPLSTVHRRGASASLRVAPIGIPERVVSCQGA
jgi:hypothetical protein